MLYGMSMEITVLQSWLMVTSNFTLLFCCLFPAKSQSSNIVFFFIQSAYRTPPVNLSLNSRQTHPSNFLYNIRTLEWGHWPLWPVHLPCYPIFSNNQEQTSRKEPRTEALLNTSSISQVKMSYGFVPFSTYLWTYKFSALATLPLFTKVDEKGKKGKICN